LLILTPSPDAARYGPQHPSEQVVPEGNNSNSSSGESFDSLSGFPHRMSLAFLKNFLHKLHAGTTS